MSKLLSIILILSSITVSGQFDEAYLEKIQEHRAHSDKEFGDTATSILPIEEALAFDHLNYYKPNPKYRITAKFKKKIGKEFEMVTSSGKKKKFRQYGKLSFSIDGKKLKLPIYQNIKLMAMEKYKDYIFIPFKDHTNGDETYGGGRYIEASKPTGKTYDLDFNYCFNPYCHYTTGYNCPIPPMENYLELKIEAGEKKYILDEAH